MIDVSVIIPVYNVERYIKKSLNTVLNQTHKNIEIILVDDGSTDASGKICDEIAAGDSRVKVIHKHNEGTGYARNSGMDAAQGEYLYFCDPDDLLDLRLIEDNYKLIKENDADISIFGYKIVWENGEKPEEVRVPELSGAYNYRDFWENFDKVEVTALWNSMFRRAFITEHKLRHTNLSNGQDVHFRYDVYSMPFNKIVFSGGVYYTYIKRAGSSTMIFKPQRTENEYKISCRYDDMLKGQPCQDGRYDLKIKRRYIWVLSMTLRNLAKAGKSLSLSEKAKIIKGAAEKEKISRTLKTIRQSELGAFGTKLMVWLLKRKLYRTTVILGELKSRFRAE